MSQSCTKNYGQNFTIFVGGIGKSVSDEALRNYFLQFGEVKRISLQPGRHGQGKSSTEGLASRLAHRGCGLLQMRDEAGYRAVIQQKTHSLEKCLMECRPALNASERKRANHRVAQDRRKVFVGGLPRSVDKKTIFEFFSRYVEVEDVTLIQKEDREHSFCFLLLRHKGAGEILFGNEYTIQQGIVAKCQEALTPQQLFEKKHEDIISQSINSNDRVRRTKILDQLVKQQDMQASHVIAEDMSVHIQNRPIFSKQLYHGSENLRFNEVRLQRRRDSGHAMKDRRMAIVRCHLRPHLSQADHKSWYSSQPMPFATFDSDRCIKARPIKIAANIEIQAEASKDTPLPFSSSTNEGSASRFERSIGSNEEHADSKKKEYSYSCYYLTLKIQRRPSPDAAVKYYTPFCF